MASFGHDHDAAYRCCGGMPVRIVVEEVDLAPQHDKFGPRSGLV